MSKTAVKESICDVCGAEIRDASIFCYNCGSAVTQQVEKGNIVKPSDNLPASDVSSNGGQTVKTDTPRTSAKPVHADRMRQRKRPVRTREVAWEEREGISISFVVTTLVLVALAVTILVAGFYFR